MTTIDTLTDEQIEALGREATEHGDGEMIMTCHEALDGVEIARARVVRAIRDAKAQS